MNLFCIYGLLVAFVGRFIKKLAIAEAVHNENNFLNGNFIFHINSLCPVFNTGPSWNSKFCFDGSQIIFDHLVHNRSAAKDLLVFGDLL